MMNNKSDKIWIKVGSNKSSPPPPPPQQQPAQQANALKLKLDLSQITNHPLVQNRSPGIVKDIEQSVLRSRTNSQVIQKAPSQVVDNNNDNNNTDLEKCQSAIVKSNSDQNNNNTLRIRRSTSMSYTSTLRKRRLLSPNEDGLQDVDFPSPRPNVKLANFSILPYSDRSPTSRRLSLKELD